MSRHWLAGAVIVVAALTAARGAAVDDLPAPLRVNVECMADVARKTPGIGDVVVGVRVESNSGLVSDDPAENAPWPRPHLDFTATDGKGNRITLEFAANRGKGSGYLFWAVLPGLSAVGEEPSDWGTNALIGRWEATCGVKAATIYE